jgi:N-methylhydantoinase A
LLVGIDVGGTFTDGMLLVEGEVVSSVKKPTGEDRLQETILAVLDELITDVNPAEIERVVLSTTLVTNLLATGRGEKTALVLIPGPGLNVANIELAPNTHIVDGAIDFRGRETRRVKKAEVQAVAARLEAEGIKKAAVVGKFSQRNNKHEQEVKNLLQREYPELDVVLGHEVAGQLNFLRRAVTTYYTAMTAEHWQRFAGEIQEAISKRGIEAPIDILKADGGTMPLQVSVRYPCETVFSGPAASAMGGYALTIDDLTSVVVDIGGTTTDLALILEGRPLYASKGAVINHRYTHVRSFAVRSLALGGDSAVRWDGQEITVGPDRQGAAACFGGTIPTPTDAFNFLQGAKIGDPEQSQQALQRLADESGLGVEELAQKIVDIVTNRLVWNVDDMFKTWEQEPAYKVWEIVHKRKVSPDRVIGIGAAAGSFVPELARRLNCESLVHRYSPVANALGACVARPTLSLLLHADTERGTYAADVEGITGKVSKRDQLEDIKKLVQEHMQKLAEERGIGKYAGEYEFFMEEQFNMIRGWSTTGKLFDVGIQIAPGVIEQFKGVK